MPTMCFVGGIQYTIMCLEDQVVVPDVLSPAEWGNPSLLPHGRPRIPCRFGPCFVNPPSLAAWHCAHLDLKSFAPFLTSPCSLASKPDRQGPTTTKPTKKCTEETTIFLQLPEHNLINHGTAATGLYNVMYSTRHAAMKTREEMLQH